jgi:23S rRNA (uracil1939-C5)-methyltransferase
VSVETRDLFQRPLAGGELTKYDAVVFDPPRAGAEEQARALAVSQVPLIVGVSCNLQSFTRDARILADGGYVLEQVTPIDQFRHSAHVELVGTFRRPPAPKPKRRGRLLG